MIVEAKGGAGNVLDAARSHPPIRQRGGAAADADSDSDGLPNSAEYIPGGNPTVAGTSGSPAATIIGGNIILTFPRNDESETPDVTLTVETRTNLLTWPAVFTIGADTAASSPFSQGSAGGCLRLSPLRSGSPHLVFKAPDTITVTIPQGTASRVFARLKVTIVP